MLLIISVLLIISCSIRIYNCWRFRWQNVAPRVDT